MTTERPPRLWTTLTADSTREEVLAAVAEQDRLSEEHRQLMTEIEFPDVPAGFTGCVASKCGRVLAHYGSVTENPARAAQDRAGEENQAPADWDAV